MELLNSCLSKPDWAIVLSCERGSPAKQSKSPWKTHKDGHIVNGRIEKMNPAMKSFFFPVLVNDHMSGNIDFGWMSVVIGVLCHLASLVN